MPIYDFLCKHCGVATERFTSMDTESMKCETCGNLADKAVLTPPKINWSAMGAQKNASPEFIDKFERMHKQQKERETKFMKEHGDYYNRAPGS